MSAPGRELWSGRSEAGKGSSRMYYRKPEGPWLDIRVSWFTQRWGAVCCRSKRVCSRREGRDRGRVYVRRVVASWVSRGCGSRALVTASTNLQAPDRQSDRGSGRTRPSASGGRQTYRELGEEVELGPRCHSFQSKAADCWSPGEVQDLSRGSWYIWGRDMLLSKGFGRWKKNGLCSRVCVGIVTCKSGNSTEKGPLERGTRGPYSPRFHPPPARLPLERRVLRCGAVMRYRAITTVCHGDHLSGQENMLTQAVVLVADVRGLACPRGPDRLGLAAPTVPQCQSPLAFGAWRLFLKDT